MGAYLIWFPSASILTLVFIVLVELPASVWLVIWFVMQFFTSPTSGVAYVAHVGGFVVGFQVRLRYYCPIAGQRPLTGRRPNRTLAKRCRFEHFIRKPSRHVVRNGNLSAIEQQWRNVHDRKFRQRSPPPDAGP